MAAADYFPLDTSELVAIFMESILFGMFFVLFCFALWILLRRHQGRKQSTINLVLIGTAVTMLGLATAHLSIDLSRLIHAFTDPAQPAVAFYAEISREVPKTILFVLQTVLGDAFVIFRVYLVWGRSLTIAAGPALLLCGSITAGCGAIYEIGQTSEGHIFASALAPWIKAFFSLTLVTNIISTGLIAGRIWWVSRALSHSVAASGSGGLRASSGSAIGTVVESGALVSAALLSMLVCYFVGSNAQYPILDSLQPLIGIVFCMIIVRVGLGYSFTANERQTNSNAISSTRAPISMAGRSGAKGAGGYPLRTVNVNVARYVHRHTDEGDGLSGIEDDGFGFVNVGGDAEHEVEKPTAV